MNYIELHIRDFIADTQGLSQSEHGAYFLLLLEYYRKAEPLPNDIIRLCSIAKAGTQKERHALTVILDQYFQVGPDGFRHNDRADEEIEKYKNKQRANQENGKLGGRPVKPKGNPKITEGFPNDNPNETQTITQTKGHQTPVPSNQTPGTRHQGRGRRAPVPPDSFEDVLGYFRQKAAPDTEAHKFWNHFDGREWRYKDGKPVVKWQAAANNWILSMGDFKPKTNGQSLTNKRANYDPKETERSLIDAGNAILERSK